MVHSIANIAFLSKALRIDSGFLVGVCVFFEPLLLEELKIFYMYQNTQTVDVYKQNKFPHRFLHSSLTVQETVMLSDLVVSANVASSERLTGNSFVVGCHVTMNQPMNA